MPIILSSEKEVKPKKERLVLRLSSLPPANEAEHSTLRLQAVERADLAPQQQVLQIPPPSAQTTISDMFSMLSVSNQRNMVTLIIL
jgi:hypothetical protein